MKLYFLGLKRKKPDDPKLELFVAAKSTDQAIDMWVKHQVTRTVAGPDVLRHAMDNGQDLLIYQVPRVLHDACVLEWDTDIAKVDKINMNSLGMRAMLVELGI